MIVLAGATGGLGGRIAAALRRRDAAVTALVRPGTAPDRLAPLQAQGVAVVPVDLADTDGLARACAGADCVVSALAGLGGIMVEGQARLLEAAIRAGVPRFVPSDFAMDFTRLPPGTNRNLDLRRIFQARLDRAPIAATSILNGAFAEMLTGQAPIVLFPLRRVLYWGDPDQPMDFTTMDDTAAYTAAACLDPETPRFLRIAGDRLSARGLAAAATEATGSTFRLVRGGSVARLQALARLGRRVAPQRGALYPPWQGMQYLHGMFSGLGLLQTLDNDRYPGLRWTTVREVLAAR